MGIIFNKEGALLNPVDLAQIHYSIPGYTSSWANDLRNFNTTFINTGSEIKETIIYLPIRNSDLFHYNKEIKRLRGLTGGGNIYNDFNY